MNASEPRDLHLVIASRFENIELVQAVLDDALREAAAGDEHRYWIGLAVREAVANAIKHGNRLDPGKRVEVEAEVSPEEVTIRVVDEGAGFDPAGVKDPLAPENRFRPDGRGILFMRRMMDEVHHYFRPEGGTVVQMTRKLRTTGGPASPQEEGR